MDHAYTKSSMGLVLKEIVAGILRTIVQTILT